MTTTTKLNQEDLRECAAWLRDTVDHANGWAERAEATRCDDALRMHLDSIAHIARQASYVADVIREQAA